MVRTSHFLCENMGSIPIKNIKQIKNKIYIF
jgi:hypothetical protein